MREWVCHATKAWPGNDPYEHVKPLNGVQLVEIQPYTDSVLLRAARLRARTPLPVTLAT